MPDPILPCYTPHMRAVRIVCFSSLMAACGTTGSSAPKEALSVATATTPPLPPITSDDQYASLRADYDAIDVGDPRRAPLRRVLAAWCLAELDHELAAHRLDAALDDFTQAAALWDPVELAKSPRDPELLAAARALEPTCRKRAAIGAELTLLAVERTLAPGDAAVDNRWKQVLAWVHLGENVEGVRFTVPSVLAEVAASWPAPAVVDALAHEYLLSAEAGAELEGMGRRSSGRRWGQLFAMSVATRVAALYLAASRPADALHAVKQLDMTPSRDANLAALLARWSAPTATPRDMLDLARAILEGSHESEPARGDSPGRRSDPLAVVERLCRDGAARFPDSIDAWQCVGQLSAFDRKPPELSVALRAFERLVALAPADRRTWEAAALLAQERLLLVASDERLGDLTAELARLEDLHRRAALRFPKQPLHTTLAGAYLNVGRGFFNAGRVDEALTYLERARAIEGSPQTLEQLAVVELKRGDATKSAADYRSALDAVPKEPDKNQQLYWLAKLHRGLGDALDVGGDAAGARQEWTRAGNAWDTLLHIRRAERAERSDSEDGVRIEGEIERGKLLYLVGERDAALEAFAHAVDDSPRRGATYADTLSFLAPRGEREAVLNVYHRSLSSEGVTEYLKVYFSMWMIDLDRRAGLPEDPVARSFLDGVDGVKWYQELARWASGRESDKELEAHADTPAKRAESAFYRAMRFAEKGATSDARGLWQRVLDTRMMAFFEFDMASFYLRHGIDKPIDKVR